MNRTKIEWVKNDDGSQGYTWNPIEGHCPNECPYCYANAMRKRFGWYDGKPLLVYGSGKQIESLKPGSSVFVCSMIELFHPKVAGYWGQAILDACASYSKVRWLFLTKCPKETQGCVFPGRSWLGLTITGLEREIHSENLEPDVSNWFASFEPLLTQVNLNELWCLDWVIIGSLNRSGRAVRPEKGGTREEWVWPIIEKADSLGIPVFIKEELLKLYPRLPRRKEVPWVKECGKGK